MSDQNIFPEEVAAEAIPATQDDGEANRGTNAGDVPSDAPPGTGSAPVGHDPVHDPSANDPGDVTDPPPDDNLNGPIPLGGDQGSGRASGARSIRLSNTTRASQGVSGQILAETPDDEIRGSLPSGYQDNGTLQATTTAVEGFRDSWATFSQFSNDDSYSVDDDSYYDYDDDHTDLDDTVSSRHSARTRTDTDEASKGSKKKEGPIEMGKRSFRWFERKVLAFRVPPVEENFRRKQLLQKCQLVRKVSKPVLTLFDVKSKQSMSVQEPAQAESATSLPASLIAAGNADEEGKDKSSSGSLPSKRFPEYSEEQWAMKNTIDYLTTQGCETASSSQSYRESLKAALEGAHDFRLKLYETQLRKRRNAVGDKTAGPEITSASRLHVERAMWRAIVNNTKPLYPLPRFILPRHRYLKKVQEQFLGPGSYELDIMDKKNKMRHANLPSTWGASCTSRFPKDSDGSSKVATAGAKVLDPWKTLDAANKRYKYPGNYVPFESAPKNFRKVFAERGSGIPPNAYNIKSPLDEFLKKRTSLRGPYDCYTPSRSVIPYGYFKTENDQDNSRLGPGTYEVRKSLLKEMNDSYNSFKGPFARCERRKMFGFRAAFTNPLWPKEDDKKPEVGQYDPDTEYIGHDQSQEFAPFKTQVGLKQKEKKVGLTAPDYYYYGTGTTWTVPPTGASMASVFRSKTSQALTEGEFLVRKKRNKATKKTLDLDGMLAGYVPVEHSAEDPSFKHAYALEDCKDECLKIKGGPKVDQYAVPSVGLGVAPVSGRVCGDQRYVR